MSLYPFDNNSNIHQLQNLTETFYIPVKTETLVELNKRYANALLPFTITLGLFGFVGIIGNIIVITIYGFRKSFKDKKFRWYAVSLAALDFSTCLTLIPAEMWKHRSYFSFIESHLCKTKCFLNVFAASSAFYCLLLVAIDRYIMTCHPLLPVKFKTFSHRAAWRLCIVMIGLGAVTAIPAAILCGISSDMMVNKYGQTTKVYLCKSEPEYEKSRQRILYRYTLGIVQTLTSIIFIVLYAQIAYAIVQVMKLKKTSSAEMDMDLYPGNSTHMCETPSCFNKEMPIPSNIKLMFLVTIVFIVTNFLYLGLSYIDQTKLSPLQFVIFSIFFRLYFIHSIINPFLYLKMDRIFRRHSLQLLRLTRYE